MFLIFCKMLQLTYCFWRQKRYDSLKRNGNTKLIENEKLCLLLNFGFLKFLFVAFSLVEEIFCFGLCCSKYKWWLFLYMLDICMWESMAYDSHNYVTHENNYMYQVTISHLSSQQGLKLTSNLNTNLLLLYFCTAILKAY